MTVIATRSPVAVKLAIKAARASAAKLSAWADKAEAAATEKAQKAAEKAFPVTINAAIDQLETLSFDDIVNAGFSFPAPAVAARATETPIILASSPVAPVPLPTSQAEVKTMTKAELLSVEETLKLKPAPELSLPKRRDRVWAACVPASDSPAVLEASAALAAALGISPEQLAKTLLAAGHVHKPKGTKEAPAVPDETPAQAA